MKLTKLYTSHDTYNMNVHCFIDDAQSDSSNDTGSPMSEKIYKESFYLGSDDEDATLAAQSTSQSPVSVLTRTLSQGYTSDLIDVSLAQHIAVT